MPKSQLRKSDMQKEHSSYEFLFTLPDSVLQAEQVLWLHVVAQALIDASSTIKEIKYGVVVWRDSEDFDLICGMAGVNTEHVRHVLNAILRDRNPKRAFKKAMTFRFLVRTYIDSHRGEVDKQRGLEKSRRGVVG